MGYMESETHPISTEIIDLITSVIGRAKFPGRVDAAITTITATATARFGMGCNRMDITRYG